MEFKHMLMMMRLSWWVMVMVMVIGNECHGLCWEQERIALLHLKASINASDTSLTSWVGKDPPIKDCCQWEGVECNTTTRRVIKLSLAGTSIWPFEGFLYLNASIFLPFQSLRTINLSSNFIGGCIENQGLGKLSSLTNLEVLDLSYNYLNKSILSSLNELSGLKILKLSTNKLEGSIYIEEFDGLNNLKELNLSMNELDNITTGQGLNIKSRLVNLEVLDLSYNYFNNNIFSFLRGLSSLKTLYLMNNKLNGVVHNQDLKSLRRLENLFMDGAILHNEFLQSIRVMNSIQVLSLQNCGLNGSIPPTQGLCELKTLRELDLKGNELRGNLPWCMMNLISLQLLDISSNHFTGNIALSPLINLTSLEYLALSDNHFQVPISFQSFFNHSRLKFIEILNNELLLENNFLTLAPTFQPISIRLSDSKGGSLFRAFPHFLYQQRNLQLVEFSQIDFGGKFPNWLLENNTKMVTLLLPNNELGGPLLLPSHPKTKLLVLDISNNHLQGSIPYKIPNFFTNLEFLNMSINEFEGGIPSSFGDMTSLKVLDLSYNRLSGEIPMHLAMGCRFLKFLRLSNNNFTGPLLPPQSNLTELSYLYLDHNQFREIPYSLSRSPLTEFNASYNQLSGRIPGWMGKMDILVLAMPDNHLEGPIPTEFCELVGLLVLDLSNNNIIGPIPSCFNPPFIQHVQLSKNRLHGSFPKAFHNTTLVMLDVSDNYLSGSIPDWIGNLFKLTILLLKNNSFQGNIPKQLCHLYSLTLIDLSFNNFFGNIPPCLNNITFKEVPEKTFVISMFRYPLSQSMPYLLFRTPFNDLMLAWKSISNSFTIVREIPNPQAQVLFTTKGMCFSYKGVVLALFSGINLSHNKLTGNIPLEIGHLSHIKVLNLSHNNLTGSIPATFSNLKNIESLDLSYNILNGIIPSQLTELYSLSDFNVSYNNLTGRTPPRVYQFGTFDSSSYKGNPFLCGEPLPRNCIAIDSPPSMPNANNDSEVDYGFIDMDTFYVSFTGSYITMLLAIVRILHVNPYWRRAWFHLVEVFVTSCYYFVMDNLPRFRIGFFQK